ncbi:MAG: heparan-alpha-glucosaminide N-acetyltransferase domain-containing protein [Mariniphaga sp.]
MTPLTRTRIESIDLLKGLVMVIMALDHTRDYFHASAFLFDPTDPSQTTLVIFFTRWITHFCAPAFSFLAGISVFMVSRRKTKSELSRFLIKRGLWLVFIELTIVNFAWYFDPHFHTFNLFVIWSLGISMIVLAGLIHLPRKLILLFCLTLIVGHNLLDNLHFEGNLLWSVLHQFSIFKLSDTTQLYTGYPLIPWIAVMALGYYFGSLYDPSFEPLKRKRLLNLIGIAAISIFILLRWLNWYGNPIAWKQYETISQSLISFMNPAKYPPSLMYLLMTLGGVFLFLANSEKLKGRIVNFYSVFGRVPFFYYVLHLYLIHILAMGFAQFSGFGWQKLILPGWIGELPGFKGYGWDLWVVYLVWIGIVALLYPLCKRFDQYKTTHKSKWWLSYL